MNPKFARIADFHSATCFLNSLFREWHNYIIHLFENQLIISIQMIDNDVIQIPLSKYSLLGRHEYMGQFYLIRGNQRTELLFNELLDQICKKLKETHSILFDPFIANVISSRNTIYHALQVHASENENSDTFINSEQALIIGHNFHPIPKHRDVLTTNELHQYAPECKGEFSLQWLFVDKEILLHRHAKNIDDKNWLNTLFTQDCLQQDIEIPDHQLPVPMHPWQWQYLQQNPVISEYVKNKKIVPLDLASKPWLATSSLRTVYNQQCSYMLKYSINLKLTNSVRVLLGNEVARGILLHDVLNTEKGKQFSDEFPNFHVITEPAYLCLMDKDGKPMESTTLVCRHNPFNDDHAQNRFMLATLIQDEPFGETNLLLKLIQNACVNRLSLHQRLKKWFHDYLEIVVKPLILAHTNYGIIMEGHQQNMVIALEEGFPVAAYFRDCQDHAYSQLGGQLFSDLVPGIIQNPTGVVSKDIGCNFFIYQIILNSTFNVITTLTQSQAIQERELLSDLHTFLHTLRMQTTHDPDCLDRLLSNETLLHKCNFQFALQAVYENRVSHNPLSWYTPVTNVILPKRTQIKQKQPPLLYQRYFTRIQKTITLRLFDLTHDLERFIAWNKNPRIAKYWQLDKTEAEVKAYLKNIDDSPHHQAAIIEIDHEPVGYAELYWTAHDPISQYYDYHVTDRGFHLLIGEDSFLGVDTTQSVFKAIMHYLYLSDHHTQRVIVEPDKHNQRFIKYMHILPGWQLIKEADLPDKRAAIFMTHRQDFNLEDVA